MSDHTGIEWTDATFNPWWGCIKVSPGCENCYALTFAKRLGHDIWGPAKTTPRRFFGDKRWQEPLKWNRQAAADPNGGVCPAIPGRLVFCSSMADVFEDHPTANVERPKLWALIRDTPWLNWQLLTKRPENFARFLPMGWGDGWPNVWLGVSTENQETANERIPLLLQTPAAVRFISAEPLLGPIDLNVSRTPGAAVDDVTDADDAMGPPLGGAGGIDWVIVGGESGPHARPCDLYWIEDLVAQCEFDGVACFVKQLGKWIAGDGYHTEFVVQRWLLEGDSVWVPGIVGDHNWQRPANAVAFGITNAKGGDSSQWPERLRVRQFPTPAEATR